MTSCWHAGVCMPTSISACSDQTLLHSPLPDSTVRPRSVRGVCSSAQDHRDVAVGETIFRQGDPGNEMFGLVSGKIELRQGDTVIGTIEPNETFGEMAIISEAPRSLT